MTQEKRHHQQQPGNGPADEPREAAPEAEIGPDAETGPEGEADAVAEPAEADAEQELAELRDRLLRAMAEVENTRRRAEREREDVQKYAITEFARDMLAVADNLRRAVESVPEEAREHSAEVANLLSGVELTERELLKAFEKHGIERVEPLGEKLDPNLHQAMMRVEDADAEPGTIVQVVQVGYVLRDRLLRPALVGVAAGRPGQGEGAGSDAGLHVDTKA